MCVGEKETLALARVPAVAVMATKKTVSILIPAQDSPMPTPEQGDAPPVTDRVNTGAVGPRLPPLKLPRRPVTRKTTGRRNGLGPARGLDGPFGSTGMSGVPPNRTPAVIIIPVKNILTETMASVPIKVAKWPSQGWRRA